MALKSKCSFAARAFVLVALVSLFGAFGGPQRASAHASYDHSSPADKQVLPSGPSALTISFVENIVPPPGTFAWVSKGDDTVSTTTGSVNDTDTKTLVVPLNSGLTSGEYDVFWKSTSADDGGVTFGHFVFFIGPSTMDTSKAPAAVSVAVPDDATDMALSNPSSADACGYDVMCVYCANNPTSSMCNKP